MSGLAKEAAMASMSVTELVDEERRLADRRAVSVPITIHLVHRDVSLIAQSASARGLFITSEHAPPVGFGLHVTLALDDGPLEAIATVVRVVPGQGIGTRLTIPTEAQRARWQHFLDTRALRPTRTPTLWARDPKDLFDFSWTNADGPEPQ
jgi:PilZ domain